MAQHRTNSGKVDTVAQHGCRCRMPQKVGAPTNALDSCPVERCLHEAIHGEPGHGTDGFLRSYEHARCRQSGPPSCQISQQRVAYVLWERQPFLPA